MKSIIATIALALTLFAAGANAQDKKQTQKQAHRQTLSPDFVKAGLKATYAIHGFTGGAVDASRVKGLIEDAEIAATTKDDKELLGMITAHASIRTSLLKQHEICDKNPDICAKMEADDRAEQVKVRTEFLATHPGSHLSAIPDPEPNTDITENEVFEANVLRFRTASPK